MKLQISNHTFKFAGNRQPNMDPRYMRLWVLEEIVDDISRYNKILLFSR